MDYCWCYWMFALWIILFSLDSLFVGFSSCVQELQQRGSQTTSAYLSHLDPERNEGEKDGRSHNSRFYPNGAASEES